MYNFSRKANVQMLGESYFDDIPPMFYVSGIQSTCVHDLEHLPLENSR